MTAELVLSSPAPHDLSALPPGLGEAFTELVAKGTPANTERTYKGVRLRYDKWCAENGLRSEPLDGVALGGYLAHLSRERAQPSTMRHLVSILSARENANDRAVPDSVKMVAERAIKGHVATRQYDASQVAYPLVPEAIQLVADRLNYDTFVGLRAGLILSLGYSVAARRSEMAAWNIGDVTPKASGGLTVHFWRSKTDQHGRGANRPVPAGHNVRTDPVTRLREYVEALASFGVDITDPTQPLLRAVDKYGKPRRVSPGKRGLSDYAVNLIIHDACRIGGLPQWESVSGHSLRAGFATASAFKLVPLAAWAEHGRWAKTSRVPMSYVRDAEMVLENPLNAVGL